MATLFFRSRRRRRLAPYYAPASPAPASPPLRASTTVPASEGGEGAPRGALFLAQNGPNSAVSGAPRTRAPSGWRTPEFGRDRPEGQGPPGAMVRRGAHHVAPFELRGGLEKKSRKPPGAATRANGTVTLRRWYVRSGFSRVEGRRYVRRRGQREHEGGTPPLVSCCRCFLMGGRLEQGGWYARRARGGR
jgi:hypothetical protein